MTKELSQTPSAARSRKWREDNPEKHAANIKAQYWANPQKSIEVVRQWRKDNPEKLRANREKNHNPLVAYMYQSIYNMAFPEKNSARCKRWGAAHKDERKEYRRQWIEENPDIVSAGKKRRYDERYNSDPAYKIQYALRNRLWKTTNQACAGKIGKTMDLLGCSMGLFMEYLSAHFKPGMTFSNYGFWHIDHRIPVSKFNLNDPEQQKQCFNFLNLQPLWAKDNIRKSNKLPQTIRESFEAQPQFA